MLLKPKNETEMARIVLYCTTFTSYLIAFRVMHMLMFSIG